MSLRVPAGSRLLPSPTRKFIQIGKIRRMIGPELERFLSDFSTEDLKQVRELWRKHAARKELIDFEANAKQKIRL